MKEGFSIKGEKDPGVYLGKVSVCLTVRTRHDWVKVGHTIDRHTGLECIKSQCLKCGNFTAEYISN